jgi:GDP-4-dehydro-6-deoxy-D-mannose reductase
VEMDPQRLRAAEIPSLIGDPAKLRALGWRPTRSSRDALADALADARTQSIG